MAKDSKQLLRCQRCGGQLLDYYGDVSCLQCGAPHTEGGKLATYFAQELRGYFRDKRTELTFEGKSSLA